MFAVRLRWFPVAGWEGFSTAVLPSLALSATVLATVARYIRAEMIEVLSSDYILLARAKGNSSLRVLFGHALRNALIPIITIIVPMLASILTGTLTIENIFGVPGLGDQLLDRLQPMISQLSWLQQYYLVHYLLFQSLL